MHPSRRPGKNKDYQNGNDSPVFRTITERTP